MRMFVVYKNPKDYPGKFVVREWRTSCSKIAIFADSEPLAVVDNLVEARAAIPNDTVLIDRDELDDPVIEEIWI